MISSVIEKRINKIDAMTDELRTVLDEHGWSEYAVKLLNKMRVIVAVLDVEDENAENSIRGIIDGDDEAESSVVIDDGHVDDGDDDSGSGGHGNTKIPFGLCQREGIEIDPNWTPRDAWDALAEKGYSASNVYEKLHEQGELGGYGSLGADIVHALRTGENQAIFFSGCALKDEDGNAVKRSPEVAREYAEHNKGATMGMLLENSDVHEWDVKNAEAVKDWSEMSKVYARQASGHVRVIARQPMRKGNIFENVEFPELKRNKKVKSVTLIDPDTGEEKVLFRREEKNESGKNNRKMGLHER